MADSNITKRALAAALKELMEQKPFSKINVAEICEKCGMNRKSFYYHFKDKYDLVNWIFDMDFAKVLEAHSKDDYFTWPFLEALCECFYENRCFYRKALKIREQNCLIDHYREKLEPFMQAGMRKILHETEYMDFQINFLCGCLYRLFGTLALRERLHVGVRTDYPCQGLHQILRGDCGDLGKRRAKTVLRTI